MEAQILEGRLIEQPTADASGMDRRAFGEFIGPRGELASYAIGWTTGQGRQVGHLSVGIGAGNPGGATFHAVVQEHDATHAFALVDVPFERVPEGGPDITAAAARRHGDLAFVWWVADLVFARDRRAWWLRHWLLGTRAVQTPEVFQMTEPVLLIVKDDDDDLWQLIGATDPGSDGKIAHLSHAIDHDQTLLDVLDLDPGERAWRSRVGDRWTREHGTTAEA